MNLPGADGSAEQNEGAVLGLGVDAVLPDASPSRGRSRSQERLRPAGGRRALHEVVVPPVAETHRPDASVKVELPDNGGGAVGELSADAEYRALRGAVRDSFPALDAGLSAALTRHSRSLAKHEDERQVSEAPR